MSLFNALFWHVSKLLTFRGDLKALPQKFSTIVYILVAATIGSSVLISLLFPSDPPASVLMIIMSSLFNYILMGFLLGAPMVSAIALIGIGTDVMRLSLLVLGNGPIGALFFLWQIAALIAIGTKYIQAKIKEQKESNKP